MLEYIFVNTILPSGDQQARFEIGHHHIFGLEPLPQHIPPTVERQMHQEHLSQLGRIVGSIRPFVHGCDEEQLFQFADEIDTIDADEVTRQSRLDWHGESRLAIDLETEVDQLTIEGIGGSIAARRLFGLANAGLLKPGDASYPKGVKLLGKGASIVLAHEYYQGNWNADRTAKKYIKALRKDPLILETHYFSNTYPSHQQGITAYKIDEVAHISGARYSISRDISYGDLVHKETGEKAEIRERSRFAIIPTLLSRENNELLARIATAQRKTDNIEHESNRSLLRKDSQQFGEQVLDLALVGKKCGVLGTRLDANIFPVSSLFVALRRETPRGI